MHEYLKHQTERVKQYLGFVCVCGYVMLIPQGYRLFSTCKNTKMKLHDLPATIHFVQLLLSECRSFSGTKHQVNLYTLRWKLHTVPVLPDRLSSRRHVSLQKAVIPKQKKTLPSKSPASRLYWTNLRLSGWLRWLPSWTPSAGTPGGSAGLWSGCAQMNRSIERGNEWHQQNLDMQCKNMFPGLCWVGHNAVEQLGWNTLCKIGTSLTE